MATDQKLPLAGAGDYANSHHHAVHFPVYQHPPPKRASKCFFYTFAFFVFICILLFIFSLVVLRPKPLSLRLSSSSLRSLRFDQSPSFRALLAARFTVRNPNIAPLRLRSATLTVLHRNATTGSADTFSGKKGRSKKVVVGARGEVEVAVEAAAARSLRWGGGVLEEEERIRVREEINSGVLHLKGVVQVTGDLVLLKKIARKGIGMLKCDIAIDLKSQRLLSFAC